MGFMLMEIGLGLYEFVLFYLVVYLFYKVYVFLSFGEVVEWVCLYDF